MGENLVLDKGPSSWSELGLGNIPPAMGAEKELKVKIPVEYHIKLHTVKVLRGQTISDTVKAALGSYLERFFAENPIAKRP
ncbi:MAG: hypothetical protein ACT4PT_02960 [Methanobacteriota archaeon]